MAKVTVISMDPANPHGLQVPTLHKMWWKMWVTNFWKSRVHVLLTSYLTLICLFSVFFFGLGALLFSVSILYLQLFVTLERLTSAALVPLEMKRCEKFLKCSDTSLLILIQPAYICLWFIMYPPLYCCALIPFNKMCINSSMWGSYLGGCPLCPGLLGVKRGCIAFPMDGKYMESLCPSSLGVDVTWRSEKDFEKKMGKLSWK